MTTNRPPEPTGAREEPPLRSEVDIPRTQQPPAAEGAFDEEPLAPEDQSDG